MRKTIREINRRLGLHIFKPGYPTGIGQYMILSSERKAALAALAKAGLEAQLLLGVGHDYNCGGDLHVIRRSVR